MNELIFVFILLVILPVAALIVLHRRNMDLLKQVRNLSDQLETLTDEARRQARAEALARRIDSYFDRPRSKAFRYYTERGER